MDATQEMTGQAIADLFDRVHRVIPGGQELLIVRPGTTVREAFAIMVKKGYSQLPVIAGHEVLGVISYRSFVQGLTKLSKRPSDVLDLAVEEFLEQLRFTHRSDALEGLLDEFDLMGSVLIGARDSISGIVTTIDVLRYFYSIASPYVLLREIELSLRELLRASATAEQLADCADASLKSIYEKTQREIPRNLESMSFQDYVSVLRFRKTWTVFSRVFGKNQDMAVARLDPLPGLRNDIFHFRREILADDYDVLRRARDWLLQRVQITQSEAREAKREGGDV